MRKTEDLWRRYHSWIGVAVAAVLTVVCYGFVVRLPFFLDDLPIMTWLSRHSWVDIWVRSSENQFYRPLAFTIYKLGRLLPSGADRAFLHGTSLLIHWASAVILFQVVKFAGRSAEEALAASILFVVFPFMFMAVPWITAMSHPLVTLLTLLATFAALKAERDRATGWWGISLLAILLAPLAHESGQVCAVTVGGVVLIQHGLRSRRRVRFVLMGALLNGGMMLLRSYIPGVGSPTLAGAQDWVENAMFFLHGLTYPLAPLGGWLVRERGARDFAFVALSALCLLIALTWLALKRGEWRWVASNLWWWAWSTLPAGLSLRYGYLYTAPRTYALAAAGTVMLWSALIFGVSKSLRKRAPRSVVSILVVALIATQNVDFLRRQAALFSTLNDLYQDVLNASRSQQNAPLGFVNLPRSLAHPEKTYAMILETVLFVPPYSNIAEFIEVNGVWRSADAVMFTPVVEETNFVFGYQGDGMGWEGMRRFAVDHRTLWLAKWQSGGFSLRHVGHIEADAPPSDDPVVSFEDGPSIDSVTVEPIADGHWAVTIDWIAPEPVNAEIFVHVRDADGELVAQVDGPALGGMVPPWIWDVGDRIHDVRHIFPEGPAPYTVQVGLFNADGRFPAYVNGVLYPDGAAPVVTIEP